jgi:hypothetical protein
MSLPTTLRSYFEPRFGRDLGDVRIHTGAPAGAAAAAIGARAYTLGHDIGFAAGEYAPATGEGRRLIAHEIAHVAQEGVAPPATIRRTVARSSRCPANVHGALADPLATLRDLDERAQLMALGAARLLASEALSIREDLGPGEASRAYRRRFGRPIALAGGRFRDRFTGAVHTTEVATTSAEMQLLSVRYELLARLLADPIRYFCPGFSVFEAGGCPPHTCIPNEAAAVCPALPGLMLICPEFWALPPDERTGSIIHEAAHMVWTFGPHESGTPGQRARNPECYVNFLADLFGFPNARSASCDALP